MDAVGLRRRARGWRAGDGVVLRVVGVVALSVVLPLWDKTMPSVVMALDRALRGFGGAPSYHITDFVARHKIRLLCPTCYVAAG